MSFRFAISPSGGIAYHIIARRRHRSLWAPFRAHVRSWLTAWLSSVESTELVVFGPSAGWTLPLRDFARFSHVLFVEPDPLARFLLNRRLRDAGVRSFSISPRADLLPWVSKTPGAFGAFLREHPSASILFANVLGQVALHMTAKQVARSAEARAEFLSSLSGRRWASYHDLFSGGELKSDRPSLDPSNVFASGDVVDHEMSWLSDGRTTDAAIWRLTKTSAHIIGFVAT